SIHRDDQIATGHYRHIAQITRPLSTTMQTGFIRSAAGQYSLNQNTIVGRQSDLVRDVRSDGQGCDIERRPANATVLGEVRDHSLRGVYRNRKPNARGLG